MRIWKNHSLASVYILCYLMLCYLMLLHPAILSYMWNLGLLPYLDIILIIAFLNLKMKQILSMVIGLAGFLTVKLPFTHLANSLGMPVLICVGSLVTACLIYYIKLQINLIPNSPDKYRKLVKLGMSAFVYSLLFQIIPIEDIISCSNGVFFPRSSGIISMLTPEESALLATTIPALGVELQEWQSAQHKFITGVCLLRLNNPDLQNISLYTAIHLDQMNFTAREKACLSTHFRNVGVCYPTRFHVWSVDKGNSVLEHMLNYQYSTLR